MRIVSLFALILMTALLAVGCKSDEACCDENSNATAQANPPVEAGMLVNKKCPMTGEDLPENPATSDYSGKKVGFCCPGCKAKWDKLTPEKMAEMLKKNG